MCGVIVVDTDVMPIFMIIALDIVITLRFSINGIEHRMIEPKLSTSPIARKTNLVGQTKPIVRRELQKYQIMHKKFREDPNNIHR